MPTVSVIIPTYNRANYICEAIDSILAQTYADYEIIVVDDGSTDGTRQALQRWIDDGTICYYYQENRGESAARNHGIRKARGQYIAFLDSDDLFLPTKFEKQVAYLEQNLDKAFVQSWYAKFDDQGNDLGYRDTSKINGYVYPEILLNWSVLLAVPSVVVRSEVLEDIGGFDESIRLGPDLDLWRRITKKYAIGVVPEVLCKIRVHPGNISGDKVSAAGSFAIYLQKAFNDDPSLDKRFQRKAMAKMLANVAHNILSAGDKEQMRYVRKFSLDALRYWPLQWSALLGLGGSFIPVKLSYGLVKIWRNRKYPTRGEKS
jgi:glycosyltransferase involved in cell wall biosynthesis